MQQEEVKHAAMQIDTKWFIDQLADKKLSQRKLAKLMGIDSSSLNLLLHGKRRMTVEYATNIARILGVPVETVIRKSGVVIDDHTGHRSLPLVGWLDADATAELDWTQEIRRHTVNAELPADAVALQFRTTQTQGAVFDGWIVVVTQPREANAGEMLDRHCLIQSDGKAMLRTIRRGHTPGRYTLLAATEPPQYDAEITWFAPVLLVVPT